MTEQPPIERPNLDKVLKIRLVDYLKEDMDSLRKFTGNDFKGWCL